MKVRKIKIKRLKKSRILFKIFNVIFWTLLLSFFLQFVYVFYCKVFIPPITFTQLSDMISHFNDPRYTFQRAYISFDEIRYETKVVFMASEDNLFLTHEGFDEKGILRAIEYNKNNPHALKGASTISQQTAKNTFLWQKKSWLRKGLEAYFTAMIEWFWGKERILEVYLNIIEFGPGIYGIEAASRHFFNKSAQDLTIDESIRLAVCLPNPGQYNPILLNEWQEGKMQRVYNNFKIINALPETTEVFN